MSCRARPARERRHSRRPRLAEGPHRTVEAAPRLAPNTQQDLTGSSPERRKARADCVNAAAAAGAALPLYPTSRRSARARAALAPQIFVGSQTAILPELNDLRAATAARFLLLNVGLLGVTGVLAVLRLFRLHGVPRLAPALRAYYTQRAPTLGNEPDAAS